MSFINSPEIKLSVFICSIVGIALTAIGFIISIPCGIMVAITALAFSAYYFIATYNRYRKINALSREIDGILHGKDKINLSEYSEGELAILNNQVQKLTLTLKQQASDLKKDKIYLADSIADISHQIRTPLTSINLITSMLLKQDISEEKRRELLKQLEVLLSRIDWLISSLLKMSKLDAGTANIQHEMVSVSELIHYSAEPVLIPMELRQQKLTINMNGDESYSGDLRWTVEAVENILKNCMEHTPVGGEIKVDVSENAIYTEIIISDNGCGIAKEDLMHLFERFYKGKDSSEQSVGIGLALARMIITNQNGTIKAENQRTGGALFRIRFYKGAV